MSSIQPFVVDVDDVTEQSHRLDLLERIKKELPEFKATLFVIPALCSIRFIQGLREFDWLEAMPHGWRHNTDRECEDWTEGETLLYLETYEAMGFSYKGFKAPGWRLSDAAYWSLYDESWWLADHPDHNAKRPAGLRTYLLDEPDRKLHFHVQNNSFKNGLEESLDFILALDKNRDFAFCREEVRPWKK
jgi:hypothetical protein